MDTKLCSNPDCMVGNPKFYPGRSLCKKCYNKKWNGVQKEKRIQKQEEQKKKDEEFENLKRTVELLTEQLDQVQVKER